MGKEENAGNQHFLLFSAMFSTLPETNFTFSVPFILSSASALNLNQSEKLSFGKDLTLDLESQTFNYPLKKKAMK